VHTIMTPLSDIFSISITDVLHFDRLKATYQKAATTPNTNTYPIPNP
jgi:hypothetical protein